MRRKIILLTIINIFLINTLLAIVPIEQQAFNEITKDMEQKCIELGDDLEAASYITTGHISILYGMADKFLPQIIDLFKNKGKNKIYRIMLLTILGTIDDARADQAILEVMVDTTEEIIIRKSCVEAIMIKGNKNALNSLINIWRQTNNRDLKLSIINTLSAIGNRRIVDERIEQMKNSLMYKDKGADFSLLKKVEPLTQHEEEQVLQIFIEGLNNNYWDIRHVSARAIGYRRNINGKNALIEAFENENSIKYPTPSGRMPSLEEEHEVVKMQIIQSLYEIGAIETVPKLLEWLNDREKVYHTQVKLKIIEVLGNFKARNAYSALLNELNLKDELVVIFAGRALAQIGNKDALPYMEKILNNLKDLYSIKHFKLSIQMLKGL